MKVLIAGDWHSELHEESIFGAVQALGHLARRFSWHEYFKSAGVFGRVTLPFLRAQNKFMMGPVVNRLNRDLVRRAAEEKPDVLMIYRGSHISPETLSRIRDASPGTVIVAYNNDDPFSPHYPKWQWSRFLAGIPEYDVIFAYRPANLAEYRTAGARRVELLPPWFIPERNRPVELNSREAEKFGCDVVFVGHYEDDERVACLGAIARAGFRLRLWGPGYDWDPVIRRIPELRSQTPVSLVWGDEYNKALCGAKIALSFHSKLNRDTYTRRSFEIPGSGAFLLSAYSNDLEAIYAPDEEAAYFRDPAELLEKVRYYLSHDERRRDVARRGRVKAVEGRHDVRSRISAMLDIALEVRGKLPDARPH